MLAGVLCPDTLLSQQITDPEGEFSKIRSVAFNGDYQSAETDARRLLSSYPEYGDARILLGRILAWEKKYTEALAVIDTLLVTEPDNADALSARKDIRLWMKDSTPVSTDIRAGYSFDRFTLPYNRYWQVFNAGASHKFKWGKGLAGLNVGNLHADGTTEVKATEIQLEAEAWPKLGEKNYGWLAYAYSPGSYFPHHRAAAELWQVLPAGWAVSAGINFYYFDRANFIATLSVEKYLGKYWFSARGYVYFKDEGPTTSLYLNGRRYFGNTDYLQVTLGMGTAPDEPFDVRADLMRLSAYSIRLAYYATLKPRLAIRIGAGYSREEYDENLWRDRYEGTLSIIYALKMK